jgi:hypothetical protein
LTAGEIYSLSKNPWQIYEPEVVWLTVASGATTSTADPDSIAVTGVDSIVTYTPVGAVMSSADPDDISIAGVNSTDYQGLVSIATAGTITIRGFDANIPIATGHRQNGFNLGFNFGF